MNKCNKCGKFLSSLDGVKCNKCMAHFHRGCLNVSPDVKNLKSWCCTGCKGKAPKNPDGESCVSVSVTDNSEPEYMKEMRLFRVEMIALREEFRQYRTELAEIHSILDDFDARMDTMEERISRLENNAEESNVAHRDSELSNVVAQLKIDLNERDQDLLSNDLEITCIPECYGENLPQVTLLIAKELGVELDSRDVVSVERVGARRAHVEGQAASRPRHIGLRLARRATRDQLLRAARGRRDADTHHLGIPGEPHRFYINERLTKSNRDLFYKARKEGRKYLWKFVWVKNGRIFARKDLGEPSLRIRNETDISAIFRNCQQC